MNPGFSIKAPTLSGNDMSFPIECRRPKFLAGDFVRVQVDGRIFVLDDGGVVGVIHFRHNNIDYQYFILLL